MPASKRVALVTGGSRGIGRATALRLARDGAAVVVNYRSDETAASDAAAAIRVEGVEALPVRANLEDDAEIAAMFATIDQRFGRLDILVANAAATAFKPLLETKEHNLARTFGITVTGFVRCVQRAVPLMQAQGGVVVAVSGFDTLRVLPGHGALGSAKAAMEALVRYLAVELAPSRIRVNGVNPGYVETDSSRMYAGPEYESLIRPGWIANTPIGRIGCPEDIANVIAFLCSAESSFICGQTIIVDGGRTLW